MIILQEVLYIHRRLIKEFGGSDGVRDEGNLLSSLARPFSGFGDTEFYSTSEEKAAAVVESIVKNHPFLDGNKRTGYALMELVLRENGLVVTATPAERYDFVIRVATGEIEFDAIVGWIQQHVSPR